MARSRTRSRVSVMTAISQVSGFGPNQTMAPMVIPPDGGWGWVIVLVGVLSTCFIDGIEFCFYLFRVPMSRDLKTEQADVSYLSSINTGCYFLGAILACSFADQWGFRVTMVLGSIVTALAFASGYILHEIMYYYILVGVIAGLGSGFVAVGGSLPAGFYFEKRRSIALGIVSCGSGLGGILMPHITELFMNRFGWRATFLFEGGIYAFQIFLGFLLLPLKPVYLVISPPTSATTLKPRPQDEAANLDDSAYQGFRPSALSYHSQRRSGVTDELPAAHATIAQMLPDDFSGVNIRVDENVDPTVLPRLQQLTQARQNTSLSSSASSVWNRKISIAHDPLLKIKIPWYKCGCCRSKYISVPGRPLMRDDLYYTGNLKRLPEYTDKDNDLAYLMEVTRVPTYYQVMQDLTRSSTAWCCRNIFTGLQYLIDYKLLKSLAFDCLILCGFGVYTAFYLPYLFCKVHLAAIGFAEAASTLVSVIGFGTLIGRLLSGLLIMACPKFDARSFIISTCFIASVAITCMVLHDNLYYKGVCLFVYGFNVGFYYPLRSLIIVDYFGLEKLTSGTGVLIVSIIFGSFLGPPLSEKAMSYTNNTNAPFYVCGASLMLASIVMMPMKTLRNWELRKEERKKNVGRRASHS